MLRVKALHQYLCQEMYGEKQTDGNFFWNDLIRRMPVALYLQVIGQTRLIEGLEQCVTDGLTIETVPDNIRFVIVFSITANTCRHSLFNRRVFTLKLNALVEVMKRLSLVR